MTDWLLQNETIIRLSFFLGIFLLVAISEILVPKRQLTQPKSSRWANNISLVALNTLTIRLLFPAAAAGAAFYANTEQTGLFNLLTLPAFITFFASIILLDLLIYLQHVMMHRIPLMWRLHRVHHTDLDYDVTTGSRFHPLEIIISMLIKLTAVVLLGAPVAAVIVFEILLNASSMFNHGNIRLPTGLDRKLRWIIVTPDMHRVHHSVIREETDSNFGFFLPWWDRMFGTYIAQPGAGHLDMTIGISELSDPKQVNRLPGILSLPFSR